MAGRWRRYQYTPPGGHRAGPGHDLIIRDDPGTYAEPYELDGRGVGREAAAWLLQRWRKGRAQGARVWCTRYGGIYGEPAPQRGSVLWTPRYGADEEVVR